MASAYFTLPSFARAKQNKEQLEKTNPQNPVLNDSDQKWLEKQLKSETRATDAVKNVTPAKIADDGAEQAATAKEQKEVGADAAQVVIPEKPDEKTNPTAESRSATETPENKPKKDKSIELPSQEEAEAATRNFNFSPSNSDKSLNEKKTWASYLPSIGSISKKPTYTSKQASSANDDDEAMQRSWAELATSYLPASWKSKDKDGNAEPVLNDDGSINEEETKNKEEREIAVLLDNLNMSSINNRVFSFSDETRKYYERFAQCLRDTIDGAPTAYEDMEKLMREAGPTLEKQFKAMPPFVRTLVKSLPAKLSTALVPELLASSSEKPGADLKAKMASDSGKTAASSSAANLKVPGAGSKTDKKKRRVPGLKSLISQEGAVAGILRNVVNFLRVRFPFLASTTNVVMSLAVFILMFVFWYCHKRGKEVRLAREADASRVQSEAEDNTAESSSDEDDDDEKNVGDDGQNHKNDTEDITSTANKAAILQQPEPAQVPLPTPKDDSDPKAKA